jgi:hypothetical protein
VRKMFMGNMPGIPPEIQALFNEIIQASQDGDITDIGGAYTITGSFTETRTLNVTAPTTANIAAVLATLILDLQRGGSTRTT